MPDFSGTCARPAAKGACPFRRRSGGTSEPAAAHPFHAAAAFEQADGCHDQHAADRQIEQTYRKRTLLAHTARSGALRGAKHCVLLFAGDVFRLSGGLCVLPAVLRARRRARLRTALPGIGCCAACGIEVRNYLLIHAVLHVQCRRTEPPQYLRAGGGKRQAGENIPAARSGV